MSSLTDLANKYGTDKGTQAKAAHGYSLVYETLMAPLRSIPRVDMLEMGLAIGGPELGGDVDREVFSSPSVNMWLDYMKGAHITGFDISDFSSLEGNRFQFVRGDSGNRDDLMKLVETGKRFDLIIDDASHASYHQQLALAVLFESLKPGGLYIIEDLGWRPAGMEASLPTVPKTARMLAEFSSSGKFPTSEAISREAAERIERLVSSISMFDESWLNAAGDSFNKRFRLPTIERPGWRGRSCIGRLLSLRFWVFVQRRFIESLKGQEHVNKDSVKLAVLQRKID